MLIYALLHLTGYDLPLQELKNFRQLHSKTAGHPGWASPRRRDHHRPAGPGHHQCRGHGAGREAAGKRIQPRRPRRGGPPPYAFLGDGCLMEGISHEACALAGAWKLNKLIALYDDNGISIDGQIAPGSWTMSRSASTPISGT